ncbi:MAG: hypothetical protein ABN482_09780 [Corticimicrobacter sp.]|uniref:hypothetical protein n=1 Tax=Corticimicrobacter sp. TaxID=2678536 RepID=UPI0032DAD709
MTRMQTETEALFASAHQALVFTFHRSNGTPRRPLMSRLADGGASRYDARGLGGVDGVAQAGMMLQCMERNLSELHFALLRARYGVKEKQCQCCGHPGRHPEWMGSLHVIAVRAREVIDRPSVTLALSKSLVLRYFEKSKIPLENIGSQCGVSRAAAFRANADIMRWLRGERGADTPGIESLALDMATECFKKAGILEKSS